jgi:hypothetical protein
MARLLRLTLTALLLAAPALLALTPRAAQALSLTCTAWGCADEFVLEFVNENTGHYLLLPADDPEVAIVLSGGAGPGWQNTGNDFTAPLAYGVPVCRFYSPVFDTHFYTADPAECEAVKHNPDWVYEKSPFLARLPVNGACPFDVPIYRVYRAGDHRYTADPALRDKMVVKGWTDEGIRFCVVSGGREALSLWATNSGNIGTAQACASTAGFCIAVDSLPPMPNVVNPIPTPWIPSPPSYLPPPYSQTNPAYPDAAFALTGSFSHEGLHTSQPADASAILKHSFVGDHGLVYINGQDRTGGDYAAVSTMYEYPGVAGATDQRYFVWHAASDRELRFSTWAYVGLVTQFGPGSQAYGGQLLQFGDAKSGHSFRITVQVYSTAAPADFVAPDARTGEPIVSTVFRPNPLFGRVLSGTFTACSGKGIVQCMPYVSDAPETAFTFSLQRADFQAALDRARTVDPALSGNPADYFLGRVAFRNETYLDAWLGATTRYIKVETWYVE